MLTILIKVQTVYILSNILLVISHILNLKGTNNVLPEFIILQNTPTKQTCTDNSKQES